MDETKIELKQKVKDSITGYVGTVTGIWTSVTSKPRALVEAVDSTGRPSEYWYDCERLSVV